jgi:S1-C subfamily serine protease
MSARSKIFLTTGIVLGLGIIALIVTHNFSSPDPSSSIPIAPAPQLLSTPASTTISSTTQQALLAATSTTFKAPPQQTITPAPVVTPPIATSTVTTMPTSTIASTTASSDPPQISPNPQSIVGILCYYNDTYTDENTGQSIYEPDDEEVRGSGVIINSKGNILTNRHIVEQPESETSIEDNNGNSDPVSVTYQLDHCDVGQLPAGSTLPSAEQIESINPYITIPVLGYTAQPVYISQTNGLSDIEVEYADFAVLAITGVSSSGPTFGVNSVPASFPYATLLPVQPYPDIMNSQVITYGFPGDVTSGQGNFFQTLTMTGSVGTVTNIYYGDQYYSSVPLSISTDLAIAHGRSGSPLFWRGYVIGIVTFFTGDNQTDSGSVASDAILKALAGTNYIPGD